MTSTEVSVPAAYDIDLRLKALAAVDRGEKKSKASRMFAISRDMLDRWLKQRKETGSIGPKPHTKRGPAPKISDLDTFRRFVKANGHLTYIPQVDMGLSRACVVALGGRAKQPNNELPFVR